MLKREVGTKVHVEPITIWSFEFWITAWLMGLLMALFLIVAADITHGKPDAKTTSGDITPAGAGSGLRGGPEVNDQLPGNTQIFTNGVYITVPPYSKFSVVDVATGQAFTLIYLDGLWQWCSGTYCYSDKTTAETQVFLHGKKVYST